MWGRGKLCHFGADYRLVRMTPEARSFFVIGSCFVITVYISCIVGFILCCGIVVTNIVEIPCAKVKSNRCAFCTAVINILRRVVIAG